MAENKKKKISAVKVEITENGKAIVKYDNRDRYEGDLEDGKMEGKGTVYYANGYRYEGSKKYYFNKDGVCTNR